MVHKKFIKRGGKVYGPYFYENYRVNGITKTKYLGHAEVKDKPRVNWLFLFASVFFILLLIGFASYSFYKSGLTGRVSLEISPTYSLNETISGNLNLVLRDGELIPLDTKVVVDMAGETKEFLLSELVNLQSFEGDYFVEGSEISDSGNGLGFIGQKTTYPEINFDFTLIGCSEEEQSEDEIEAPVEETQSDEEETTSEESEQSTAEVIEGSSAEDSSEESGEDSEPASSPITGEVVLDEETFSGSVSAEEPFEYSLGDCNNLRIENVDVGSKNDLDVEIVEGRAIVTTDYSETEEGFGEDYLGEENEISINLSSLNVLAKEGEFRVEVVYNDAVLTEASEEIVVEGLEEVPEENETIPEIPELPINETLVNETIVNESENVSEFRLLQNVPDLEIAINSNTTLELSEYFAEADSYEFADSENITFVLEDDVLTIIPDENFTGSRTGKITAFREVEQTSFNEETNEATTESANETLESNEFLITVSESNFSIQTVQYGAVIGKPVKWKKVVQKSENQTDVSVEVPAIAKNITVYRVKNSELKEELENIEILEGSDEVTVSALTGNIIASNLPESDNAELESSKIKVSGDVFWVDLENYGFIKKVGLFIFNAPKNLVGNVVADEDVEEGVNITIEDNSSDYEIEYYTEAPYAVENETSVEKKEITIVGPDEVHYENVLAYSELPIELASIEAIKLYHLEAYLNNETNESQNVRVLTNFTAYDSDNNSLYDYIEWIVPHLSNQSYELEIVVLNVYSHPSLQGNWSVYFNTTGTANLTITATINESYSPLTTRWTDESEDAELYDLRFLEIKCGEEVLNYSWIGETCSENECSVFIENYSCNETGVEISKVLTPVKHILKFEFGGQTAWAFNDVVTKSVPYDMKFYSDQGHIMCENGSLTTWTAPTGPYLCNFSSVTNDDYVAVQLSDNTHWGTSLVPTGDTDVGKYDYQIFHFKLMGDVNNITALNFTWEGKSSKMDACYGGCMADLGAYIWNSSGESWKQVVNYPIGLNHDSSNSLAIAEDILHFINQSATGNWVYLYARFPQTSCPYIYTWDGESYNLEAEGITSFGTVKESEAKQPTKLNNILPEDGLLKLKVSEELPEVSYLDSIELLEVSHPLGTEIYPGFKEKAINGYPKILGRDLPVWMLTSFKRISERFGEIFNTQDVSSVWTLYTIREPLKPLNVTEKGEEVPELMEFNSKFWGSDLKYVNLTDSNNDGILDTTNPEEIQKTAVFTFPYSGQEEAKLLLRIKQTKVMPYLAGTLYHNLIENDYYNPVKLMKHATRETSYQISVWDGNQWINQVFVNDYPKEVPSYIVVPLKLKGVNNSNPEIQVKVTLLPLLFELDSANIDYSADEEISLERIPLRSAIKENESVKNVLETSNNHRLTLSAGEDVFLEFEVPSIEENTSYFLNMRGYYLGKKPDLFQEIKDKDTLDKIYDEPLFGPRYFALKGISYSNQHNTVYTDYVKVEATYALSNFLDWEYSLVNLGAVGASSGNVSNIIHFNSYGENDYVNISCVYGNCSNFWNNWSQNTNVSDSEVAPVLFKGLENDTAGIYSAWFFVNSSQDSIGSLIEVNYVVAGNASVSLIYPKENLNVLKDGFFNVTFNVSCYSGTCGSFNLSLLQEGAGTDCYNASQNPIPICTLSDLNKTRLNLSGNYVLMNDIDASATRYWQTSVNRTGFLPIGENSTTPFRGTFDGKGHTIRYLYEWTNQTNFIYPLGLFGSLNGATIKNLRLENLSLSGLQNVGGIAGQIPTSSQTTIISNCSTSGNISANTIANGGYYVGGLVGISAAPLNISNCYSEAYVSANFRYAGGFVGQLSAGSLSIFNSYFAGWVLASNNYPSCDVYNSSAFTCSNNYYNNDTCTIGGRGCAVNKSTAQMMNQTNYTNWDFVGTWDIINGSTYPWLKINAEPAYLTISTAEGYTPFYTNASANPNSTTSLSSGESQVVSFWVNASGDYSERRSIFGKINTSGYGNITEKIVLTISDVSAPAISFTEPTTAEGGYTIDSIWANISVSDNNEVGVINITLWNASGLVEWNSSVSGSAYHFYNFTGLGEGAYYLNASANDSSGNTNSTETRTIYLDFSIPFVNFTTPTTSEGNQSANSIWANISANDAISEVDTINITLWNSTDLVNYSSSNSEDYYFYNFTGLADGTYYLNASANDSSGNTNYTSTRTINVDSTAPQVEFVETTTESGAHAGQNYIEANVSATDSIVGVDTINITVYNDEGLVEYSNISGVDYYFYNFTSFLADDYYLNATVKDILGNTNYTETRTITLGNAPEEVSSRIYSEMNLTNESLAGYCNATDSNGDNLTYYYQWYLNGAENKSGVTEFFDTLTTTTVESANDVGEYSSIALDSNGVAHISNYDSTNGDLRICNNSEGSWSCAIADSTGVVGSYSSIAVDSNNNLHVSYYDDTNDDLRYCNNSGGTWSCTTVDSEGIVGRDTSIAIDSYNNVHISHMEFNPDYDLRYCNNSGGTWSCVVVDSTDYMGFTSSIVVDSNNISHISEYAYTGGNLKYCNNSGGTWSCTNIDSTNNVGSYTSLARDSTGYLHISHYDLTNRDLRYCNNTAGSWSCATIDTANDVGQYSSIVLDANDKVHITALLNISSEYYFLRYCNNVLGSWNCSNLSEIDNPSLGTPNGRNLAIKKGRLVDSTSFSNNAYLSWYNNTDLMYTLVPVYGTPTNFTQGVETNVDNISSSWLQGGQNWTLSCLASDSVFNSSWLNSSDTYIEFQPNMTSTRIYSATNLSNETLQGFCNSTLDNGNNVSYSYTWWKNGVLNLSGIFNLTETLNTTNIEVANSIGTYSSIALDLNESVHVAYYYVNDLRYCNNTAGTWSCTTVESTNDVGKHTSIAIDSNDKVHISHFDNTNSDLRYCNNTAGTWSCTTIESTNVVGMYTSIAIDSNDKVHISHFDDTNDDLRYCNNTAGTWSCTTVDSTNTVGPYSSIAIDSNDKVHITSLTNFGGLRYCNNTAGTFNCSTISSATYSYFQSNGRGLAIKKGRLCDSTSFSNNAHLISLYAPSSSFSVQYTLIPIYMTVFSFSSGTEVNINNLSTSYLTEGDNWSLSCVSSDVVTGINSTSLMSVNTTLVVTYPKVDFISPTTGAGDQEGLTSIWANVTASDVSGIDTINITLWNASGLVNLSSTNSADYYFYNFTGLAYGTYYLNATANDSVGNVNSSETITINLLNPKAVNVEMIYPISEINVSRFQFFNLSFNVTCLKGECGTVNVTLFSNESLLNSSQGAIPFYTNASSNPLTTSSLGEGQGEVITFWVNATGEIDTTHEFFAYANLTSDLSVNNESERVNITIQASDFGISIDLSPQLAEQINWSLDSLPIYNQSAEGNNGAEETNYYVNISCEMGSVDVYMKADSDLMTAGLDVLGIGNETYSFNSTNSSVPSEIKTSLTASYSDNKIGDSLTDGSVIYLKFFINAPSGQAAGNYNNSLSFKAVPHGTSP